MAKKDVIRNKKGYPTTKKEKVVPIKYSKSENELTASVHPIHGKNPHECLQRQLMNITGACAPEIAAEILDCGGKGMPRNIDAAHNRNILVQTLVDFEPQNAIEARLCTQAAALFAQGMRYFALAETSIENMQDNSLAFPSIGEDHNQQTNLAVKLLRLHNETVEQLLRLRRGGEQRVIVQHVNVTDGGQAIVGSVLNHGGGGGASKMADVPHD